MVADGLDLPQLNSFIMERCSFSTIENINLLSILSIVIIGDTPSITTWEVTKNSLYNLKPEHVQCDLRKYRLGDE